MQEFEFTLHFKLGESNQSRLSVIEQLGANGCTDALVGLGVQGQVALQFCRKAASLEQALTSAIEDVKRALPAATFLIKDTESRIK